MIIAPQVRRFIVSVFLLRIVFSSTALAHIETARFSPPDVNAGDSFGASVAIDGDIAVVGAYMNDSNCSDGGAAYVYELSGSQWIEKQKLIPSDVAAGDQFGRSVAIQGNTIVVGSYLDDNKGSAYIFTNSGVLWLERQKLVAPNAASGDKFGCSVAIDNNTIVIGAYNDDSQAGSVSVFTCAGLEWSYLQKLTASDSQPGDRFGYCVVIDNNTIIIGAPYDDYYVGTDVGSGYVYQLQGTTYTERYILRASDGDLSYHFGYSVALDGNWAVIGAYEADTNIVSGAGAAYVFTNTNPGWVEQQKLFDANSPVYGEDFGRAVAIKNDTILAGCVNDSVNGKQAGAVFEFVRDGSTWVQSDRLTAGDANTGDKFGSSLALSGPCIIIGSPYNYNNDKSTGSAYIFNDNDAVTGDFDGDFDVDFIDFAVLAVSWLQNNPLVDIAPEPAGDGIVDIEDLAVFCDNWLAGK